MAALAARASFTPSFDTNGLPVRLALTTGKALDNCPVLALLAGPEIGSDVACGSVDRGYDAEWIRALDGPHCTAHGQTSHRNEPGESGPSTALAIQSSCSSTRLSNIAVSQSLLQTAGNYLAVIQLAAIRLRSRINEVHTLAELSGELVMLLMEITFWSPLLRLEHEELVGPGFSAPDFALAARDLPYTGVGVA
jgi:hypothetical protein